VEEIVTKRQKREINRVVYTKSLKYRLGSLEEKVERGARLEESHVGEGYLLPSLGQLRQLFLKPDNHQASHSGRGREDEDGTLRRGKTLKLFLGICMEIQLF